MLGDDMRNAMLRTAWVARGNDRKTWIVKSAWIALSAGAAFALGGCAQADLGSGRTTDLAAERGAEERPPQRAQVTLPPSWTSTAPPPSPQPVRDWDAELSAEGPWLLYCDTYGWSALMDVDGPGRNYSYALCVSQQQVWGASALAVKYGRLLQFPTGEEVKRACCILGGWSADGNLALL